MPKYLVFSLIITLYFAIVFFVLVHRQRGKINRSDYFIALGTWYSIMVTLLYLPLLLQEIASWLI